MLRPFLSLVVAAGGTVAGLSLTWLGAAASGRSIAFRFADPGALVLAVAGILLVAVAAASLAIHWVGVIVVGAIHGLLGLLAVVVPLGNPVAGGIFSPVFQITGMMASIDPALGEGARVFYFSGTALVLGAFLVGAALGVRSRRLAGPAGVKAVTVTSVLGGFAVLATSAVLVVGGGLFVRSVLMLFRYDPPLAALTVAAGLLAGIAGLLLRWSSLGAIVAAALVLVAGVVLFAAPSTALPYPGNLVGTYGLVVVAGGTFLAAAIGGTVRGGDEVSELPDAL